MGGWHALQNPWRAALRVALLAWSAEHYEVLWVWQALWLVQLKLHGARQAQSSCCWQSSNKRSKFEYHARLTRIKGVAKIGRQFLKATPWPSRN